MLLNLALVLTATTVFGRSTTLTYTVKPQTKVAGDDAYKMKPVFTRVDGNQIHFNIEASFPDGAVYEGFLYRTITVRNKIAREIQNDAGYFVPDPISPAHAQENVNLGLVRSHRMRGHFELHSSEVQKLGFDPSENMTLDRAHLIVKIMVKSSDPLQLKNKIKWPSSLGDESFFVYEFKIPARID